MRRGRASLLAAALLASGCSREEPPPTPPPPPVAKLLPTEPAVPPLGEVAFRDWGEIDEEKFLELPAPSAPPVLKWNFEPGRRYTYDFSETLSQQMEQESNGKHARNHSREKNRGVFEFAAGRDHTALAMAKIQTSELFLNDQAAARESLSKRPTSVSEAVVTEEGVAESKSSKGLADSRMYLQSLFALQPRPRTLNPGTITTRLAGYNKVERYECARLESELEILVQKPSELLLLRGRVVGYFALAERKFIRASATVATSSRANALTKEGAWITSRLDAVTHFRIRFLETP